MDRIGVRELRQHASRYLRRVASGETIEVTDRGRAVARLVPVSADAWTDLVLSGRVVVPDGEVDVADEAPADYGVEASGVLVAMREEER